MNYHSLLPDDKLSACLLQHGQGTGEALSGSGFIGEHPVWIYC
mgnify:CR=1 FL=1